MSTAPWQLTRDEYAQDRERAYIKKMCRPISVDVAFNISFAAARYHRVLVEQALAAGETVPAEVLADYPELTAPQKGNPS